MEVDSLHNGVLHLAVNRIGAELSSIKDAAGIEYLWQGDPRVWNGRSPLLFPVVGRLAGDSYSYAGRTYSLPQHGFARRKPFRRVGHGRELLSYSLGSDTGTREVYPFDFDLTVTYRLDANSIHTGYRVTNLDGRPLPFSIGGHPGLSCSWHAGDVLEDYFLDFEQEEIADTCPVRNGLIAIDETRRIMSGSTILPLTKTRFDDGALVFMSLASSSITLRSRRHPNRVEVGFPGFPCLGIWSKPDAPFVCIEPWFGHADPTGTEPGAAIETKPGIVILAPGLSFECEWRISISS